MRSPRLAALKRKVGGSPPPVPLSPTQDHRGVPVPPVEHPLEPDSVGDDRKEPVDGVPDTAAPGASGHVSSGASAAANKSATSPEKPEARTLTPPRSAPPVAASHSPSSTLFPHISSTRDHGGNSQQGKVANGESEGGASGAAAKSLDFKEASSPPVETAPAPQQVEDVKEEKEEFVKPFARGRLTVQLPTPSVSTGICIGEKFVCSWHPTDSFVEHMHPVEVLASRAAPSGQLYYVHYILEKDRRNDCWVNVKHLRRFASDSEKAEMLQGHAGPLTPMSPAMTPSRRLTRRDKRRLVDVDDHDDAGRDPELHELEKEHEQRTMVKNFDTVWMGQFEIPAWYHSPFPKEVQSDSRRLYFCEYCFCYMRQASTLLSHMDNCRIRHPPGNEIYRDDVVSMFEVDGAVNRRYCQCLCLFSKLFLDHKTLYFDVGAFYFYVLCEVRKDGFTPVGYFSKEKDSVQNYNLACILSFPQYQRRGFGRFLIQMSYELSKIEGKQGSPEKPLSDLGRVSYRSYWVEALLNELIQFPGASIEQLCARTAMEHADVLSTLEHLGLIAYVRGQKLVQATESVVQQHIEQIHKREREAAERARAANLPPRAQLQPALISWVPPPKPKPRGTKASRHR